jgi:hypothetical protein
LGHSYTSSTVRPCQRNARSVVQNTAVDLGSFARSSGVL